MLTHVSTKRWAVCCFLLIGLFYPALCRAESSTDKPNFVIIFADDLGYGDLGCYGHPTIRTPNLDRLSAEGLKFTQFYAASAICSPSRASLLTGRLPKRCGVNGVFWPHSKDGLPTGEITVAELLRKEGYATACIGKWHLGHKAGYRPTDRGFDLFYGIPASNDMWINSEAEFAESAEFREGTTLEQVRSGAYEKHQPAYVPVMRNEKVVEFPANQRTLTKQYTEEAIKFIEDNKDAPFFLYLPNNAPHTPLFASDSFEGKSLRGRYGDVVEEIDWSVGEVIKALKQNKLDKNTLVIFTSDNGPWVSAKFNSGSAGALKGGKFTTWEGGFREPAIAWWPGTIPAGQVNTDITSTLDLMPTLLDFAGGQAPGDRVIDGYSLRETLTEQAPSPREHIYYYRHGKLRAVRMGPWKMHYETMPGNGDYKYTKHDPPLLFKIDQDPGERYDVSKNNKRVIEQIQKHVAEHKASFE